MMNVNAAVQGGLGWHFLQAMEWGVNASAEAQWLATGDHTLSAILLN